ncbi:MAG TPA: sensor histidine kinase [Povalibacter sp.]|uniref:sensor histidine kinase n=1 Tax=Povalibacter sp. TaxID=1962978 RepID=UPI002C9C7EF0|nr:sensor histidine kinase [Povalibacter sp.]HMN46366.1 sensor histidine kinase [Povalibacter sp.]
MSTSRSPAGTVSDRAGLLDGFSWRGCAGPVVAFVIVLAAFFHYRGWTPPTIFLAKLWTAHAVAFALLAAAARWPRVVASTRIVIAAAAVATLIGGLACVLVGIAPYWWLAEDAGRIVSEWLQGSGFAAFFIAWPIALTAVTRQRNALVESRRQLAESRLHALQAQIEPHFLMNTLANLRHLIRRDGVAAATMLDHLADFLQNALQRTRTTTTTLGQELELIDSYLSIMRIRLADRLTFSIRCEERLKAMVIPPLLLQPLVENAVEHGIEPSEHGGSIDIAIDAASGRLRATIGDDGVGFDAARVNENGVGLKNVRERLATLYGADAVLTVERRGERGTVATLLIPGAGR